MKPKRLIKPIILSLVLLVGLFIVLTVNVKANFPLPPVVVALNPEPNSFTAPRTTTVSVEYNQTISPTTVNYQTFAVHAMQTGWITQNLAVAGGEIILTPKLLFHPGELVQASATTGTLNMANEGPISPTVWQFWAGVDGGYANFYDSGQRLGNDDNRGLALGDLNGDGDLDAFVSSDAGPSQVYFNDGLGVFSDSGQLLGISGTIGIALGDLNGDGDLDAFQGNWYGPNQVWWNDGSGIFSNSGQNLGAYNSVFPALGDLDGDGDLDAFVPNGVAEVLGEPNKVYFNDGNGVFSDSGQNLGMESSVGVALGDLDDDGDLDAFVTNYGANKVWLNNGNGVFTETGQLLGNGNSVLVALGDLNGDQHLDAFVSNSDTPLGGPDEVWLNDGSGTFVFHQALGNSKSGGLGMGDLDNDGDLDALVCTIDDGGILWLNDGTGSFTDGGQVSNYCVFPGLGDLDGDGDLDAFLAKSLIPGPLPDEVWFNSPFTLFMPAVFKP